MSVHMTIAVAQAGYNADQLLALRDKVCMPAPSVCVGAVVNHHVLPCRYLARSETR